MVDISKIKVGDYVTVRTKVLGFEGPTADALPVTIDPNPWAFEIIAHEPGIAAETVEDATARVGNEIAGRIAAATLHRGILERAAASVVETPLGKLLNRQNRKAEK
jgi:hypothetical protein